MYQKSLDLVNKMNLNTNILIINQSSKIINTSKDIDGKKLRMLSYKEKGLSKSRNRALEESNGIICLIADDDMYYYNDLEKKVLQVSKHYPEVDVFIFKVNNHKNKFPDKIKRLRFLDILKISSVQIAFRRGCIISKNIRFNEDFGAGSDKYSSGEENIFLKECLDKKLKVYYFPITIGTLTDSPSTWFQGFNEKFFYDKGALFYKLTKFYWLFLIFTFAFKKYKLYKNEISFLKAVKNMFLGAMSLKRKQ